MARRTNPGTLTWLIGAGVVGFGLWWFRGSLFGPQGGLNAMQARSAVRQHFASLGRPLGADIVMTAKPAPSGGGAWMVTAQKGGNVAMARVLPDKTVQLFGDW